VAIGSSTPRGQTTTITPGAASFYSDDAYAKALALDALRLSGAQVPLIWEGNAWTVVSDFAPDMRRFPTYSDCHITAVVARMQCGFRGPAGG
jgi:hypothetical protein